MRQRPKKSLVLSAVLVALGLAGWLYVGPQQFGGSASYAVLHGTSMEPNLQRGDLAIVRSADAYRVGDVVLYHDPALGMDVLHRIVGRAGGRFVLKGDNNSFQDPARPAEAQIRGKLLLGVPVAGRVFGYARNPLTAALLAAAAALLLVGGGVRRRREPEEERAERRRHTFLPADPFDSPLVLAVGGVAALFAVFAVAALFRAPERTVSVDGAYAHAGVFAYAARTTPSPVYPRGRLKTGDVVFLKLVDKIDVSFAYRVRSPRPLALTGSAALVAELSDGRGWTRSLPLSSPRPFAGDRATVRGTLDLAALRRLITEVESLTGSATYTYAVKIKPRISVAGRVGESSMRDSFSPALGFSLDAERFRPDLAQPLVRRTSGALEETVANTLTLGPAHLTVGGARRLALLGLLASLICGSLALLDLRRAARGLTEPALIEARFGQLLLPVRTLTHKSADAIDVIDFESLVRLAQHHDTLILHSCEAGAAVYAIETGSAVYRYGAGAGDDVHSGVVIEHPSARPPVLAAVETKR